MTANDNFPMLPLAEARRILADHLAAVDAVLAGFPDRADDLMRAFQGGGVDGVRAFLAGLGQDTAARVLAAFGRPGEPHRGG